MTLEECQMSLKKIDTKALDDILEKMISTVDNSKSEIFQIGEQCRQDFDSITSELKEIKIMVGKVIEEGDELEVKTRYSRRRLSEVSLNFRDYTEEQVRNAYEVAHNLQMKLSMNRELEKNLRKRRDELERRLINLQETIERADHLVSQTSVVLNYLTRDLKQIGSALEDAKERQDFGLKVIEAQEEERKRLSREIHDGPAQMLANMLIRSDLIEKIYRERGAQEAINEVSDLKRMVRSSLYEVRRIIYDLRPMALDDLGLVPTLRKYLARTEEYNNGAPHIQFFYFGEEVRLHSNYEVALFRLVQESVQNALKHAECSVIQVKLEMQKERIVVIIKDNGKGFDVRAKKEGSFGIVGMKERIELLNGNITIDSKQGLGTIVTIQVPIED